MKQLVLANEHLGDRPALDALFQREGYLCFKDVIDTSAVAALRADVMSVLADGGFIEPGVVEPLWTGKIYEGPTARYLSLELMGERGGWQRMVSHPSVAGFVEDLLGGRPDWLPMPVFRMVMPGQDPGYRRPGAPSPDDADDPPDPEAHQDAFVNPGLAFRIFWFPLVEIDVEMGGLALVPRMHSEVWGHDRSRFTISGASLNGQWHRADYRPGDLVVLHHRTPHAGLPNRTDRHVRLSVDLRCLSGTDPRPVIGEVVEADPSSVTIHADHGTSVSLALDDRTYVWDIPSGSPVRCPVSVLAAGQRVIAAHEDGRAICIRVPYE
jgi:hypothetical protein